MIFFQGWLSKKLKTKNTKNVNKKERPTEKQKEKDSEQCFKERFVYFYASFIQLPLSILPKLIQKISQILIVKKFLWIVLCIGILFIDVKEKTSESADQAVNTTSGTFLNFFPYCHIFDFQFLCLCVILLNAW